jgi:hypothetical protein
VRQPPPLHIYMHCMLFPCSILEVMQFPPHHKTRLGAWIPNMCVGSASMQFWMGCWPWKGLHACPTCVCKLGLLKLQLLCNSWDGFGVVQAPQNPLDERFPEVCVPWSCKVEGDHRGRPKAGASLAQEGAGMCGHVVPSCHAASLQMLSPLPCMTYIYMGFPGMCVSFAWDECQWAYRHDRHLGGGRGAGGRRPRPGGLGRPTPPPRKGQPHGPPSLRASHSHALTISRVFMCMPGACL